MKSEIKAEVGIGRDKEKDREGKWLLLFFSEGIQSLLN